MGGQPEPWPALLSPNSEPRAPSSLLWFRPFNFPGFLLLFFLPQTPGTPMMSSPANHSSQGA